ncbi:MAG: enoyl-CoA hydratase [Chloroflexi bacterium]|nr:enoyl-CoA hydratase [Chloroflexota bacterium]
MAYERILYEKIDPGIVKITLNRPEKRNALDNLTVEEVQDAFTDADLDEDVRVIILAGAGTDFCSGYDISGKGALAKGIIGRAVATKLTGMEARLKKDDYLNFGQPLVLRNVSKPTIAMVQGNCIAGGWLHASMCDIVIASDDAQFADPVTRWASAGVEILFHPYDVGFRKAKEMLFTGDPISAQEAKEYGLVNKIFPREKLEEETLALARKIATNKPVALSLAKRSINEAMDLMGQRDAWKYHMMIHQLAHASDEAKRWQEERAKAMGKGGVKEVLKARDDKFQG